MQTLLNKINKTSRILSTVCVLLIATATVTPGVAQNQPAFLFEGLLDTYFDDSSGLIAFDDYDLAFASDEPLAAQVCVSQTSGTEVGCLDFRPQYRNKTGVIARASVSNPGDISLKTPGDYVLDFVVNGQPVTRMPVSLEKVASDDAFNPESKLQFYGPWSDYAHITMSTWKGEDWPLITFWAGHRDMAEETFKAPFLVELSRNGSIVAHSKRTQGTIPNSHYDRLEAHLYHPHDRKGSPNAKPFLRIEWVQDGDYVITVKRQFDNVVIRRFRYNAAGGAIALLPQTQMGYQPRTDYLVPRVIKKGSTGYEFVEAIWLKN